MMIEHEELGRTFMWYCISCTERRTGIATNHTALQHIDQYPTHVVLGFGSTTYKFSAATYQGRPVEDTELPPMSTLHDPADRYYSDQGTGESLE